jgi:hypothetical protein
MEWQYEKRTVEASKEMRNRVCMEYGDMEGIKPDIVYL